MFSGEHGALGVIRSARLRLLISAAAIILLVVASLRLLPEPYYDFIWDLSASDLIAFLPATLFAALRVWTFWALATFIIGEFLLRADPEIGLFDAVFGGATGTWVFAYIAGTILGPIGLLHGWTIWLILFAAAAALVWRRPGSEFRLRAPSTGLQLALLACALMAIGVLPMQLGSPVPPYMDVLNNPASAQRIVTFHRYVPWDNDPYGHWAPGIQTPGLELFYALLALGSATPIAVMAETAATLPMLCLIVLATWRLGRTLIGDTGGGMAAVLLLTTTIFMRGIQMRGTAVAFVLVAGGLAFMLDRVRRPTRTVLGAIMLGCAFASHAIDAAMGFMTVAVAVMIELLDGDLANAVRQALCLAGALLITIPEFAVAFSVHARYPLLPICQIAGIAVVYLSARNITPRRTETTAAAQWILRGLIVTALAVLSLFPSEILISVRGNFPILMGLCLGGLALTAIVDYRDSGRIWIVAVALLIADAVPYAVAPAMKTIHNPQAQFGLDDIILKLDEYWSPYFLVFPAAVLFNWVYRLNWAYRRWSQPLLVAALLVFAVFPWMKHPQEDITYSEHPIVYQWAVNWQVGKLGWWGNSPDHRWLQSPDEFALIQKLRDEIRAGHISFSTHVIHIDSTPVIWKDELLYSLYTGIDDDLYLIAPDPGIAAGNSAGGRMHPIDMLQDVLAQKPPYLAIYHQPPSWLKLPPPGYDEIFHQGDIRLFRREGLGSSSAEEPR